MTFLWLLLRTPVTWAKTPDDVPLWELVPSRFWADGILPNEMYKPLADEPKPPGHHVNNYPRLVRMLELQAEFPFNAEPPKHPYELLSKLLPDFYAHIFSDFSEQPRATLQPEPVKLNKIKKIAEDHGLLVHPKFGSSAYAWASTACLFQTLLVLRRILELDFDKDDPLGYYLTVERLKKRWGHIPDLLIEGQRINSANLSRPPVLKSRTDTHPPKPVTSLPSKKDLRRELLAWLNKELNRSIEGPAQSDLTFYVDQTKGMKLLLAHEANERLPKGKRLSSEDEKLLLEGEKLLPRGEAIPYFGVKAGLYAYALYSFLTDFRKGGKLKTCAGCGRLFFPTRKNAKHCNVSRDSCRKRTERKKKAMKLV